MSAYTAAYSDIRINDAARFRAQGLWLSDQLTALGWTKTADAGQIDWASVAAPGAADTAQGYEIRQSGEGLYLKIEYGSGTAAYAKALWLTLGTGSDGAGAITGQLLARTQMRTQSGSTGTVARAGDDFVAGSASRIALAVTDDTNPLYGGAFVLQKTHDAAQTEDAAGWWLFVVGYNVTGNVYCIGSKHASGAATKIALVKLPRSVGDASNVPTMPCFAPHPLYGQVAMRDLYVVTTSLVSHQAAATIAGKTYVSVFGNATSANIFDFAAGFALSLMMRYD